ncbi:MAG: MaoC family dehydratase N-terminal domain-containing protein [Betaproteobacteria bacterium]|nr:MaoC family dehydratase N-terminal domain-containing protein [Betaproteobacteria bacterium]
MTQDEIFWRQWIGKTDVVTDTLTAWPVGALAATLDRDEPVPPAGSALPPLAHWLYFLPRTVQSDLGPDGHAKRGGFLPPIPLPRRLWAGGRVRFFHPLWVGEPVQRTSVIADIQLKLGRSGELVFVTVRHEIRNAAGLAVTEDHDIVYRAMPEPGAQPQPGCVPPTNAQWHRQVALDEVLLFRFSALTFNSHRIHYDQYYVTQVEAYPGLVVHAPLCATLLLDLLRRHLPDRAIERFDFRALRPVYAAGALRLAGNTEPEGRTARLWAVDADGFMVMEAQAHLA